MKIINITKVIGIIVVVIFFAGCTTQEDINNRIIRETNKCIEAGLKAETLSNGYGVIREIQCVPDNQLNKQQ